MKGKFANALSLALILAMLVSAVVFADNTVADGDGVTPVGDNNMSFGTVCAGSTTTQTALVNIKRNGAAGSTNVFKDSSTVAISVFSVSGSGLSALMGSPATITLPSNWGSLAQNTASDYVSSDVTLVAGAAGSFSGSVTYRGAGVNSSNDTINRDDIMNVTATIEDCTPVDNTPPTITINTPVDDATYLLNEVVLADYSCDDGDGSGVDYCTGPVANGAAIDTSSVGEKEFTVNAADNAGNTNSASASYSVIYDWDGFFQPIDNNALNAVKAGSAIPVKFSLSGDQGLNIFAVNYPRSVKVACDLSLSIDDIEQTVNAGGSSLSYDALADQYVYVWKTEKSWAGTCRQLQVMLNDGTVHTANFKFK